MTARLIYEYVLIEMNKVNAPSILLEDFNYLFNKAINLYINKKYNNYDVNQQSTDDLRVLKATVVLHPKLTTKYGTNTNVGARDLLFGATYEVNLPDDYLHMLNCICNFRVTQRIKCYDANTNVQFGAYKLTSDIWSQVINNFYMKPSYKRPYYFIHNVDTSEEIPTNPYTDEGGTDADMISVKEKWNKFTELHLITSLDKIAYAVLDNSSLKIAIGTIPIVTKGSSKSAIYYLNGEFDLLPLTEVAGTEDDVSYMVSEQISIDLEKKTLNVSYMADPRKIIVESSNFWQIYLDIQVKDFPRTKLLSPGTLDLVEKVGKVRYGNTSKVRMEIRCGRDHSVFELQDVYIDYVKTPLFIRLTQELIDLDADTSQIMEFPDYVCQEIINELTHILMENASDLRIQSHSVVSLSIGLPAQQLAQS